MAGLTVPIFFMVTTYLFLPSFWTKAKSESFLVASLEEPLYFRSEEIASISFSLSYLESRRIFLLSLSAFEVASVSFISFRAASSTLYCRKDLETEGMLGRGGKAYSLKFYFNLYSFPLELFSITSDSLEFCLKCLE